MNCPKCASPTEILQTKTTGEGFHQRVRRRHRCLHCKERFSSVERFVVQKSVEVPKSESEEIPGDAVFSEGRDSHAF
jgi:transcriptional regulator NrdR family protein